MTKYEFRNGNTLECDYTDGNIRVDYRPDQKREHGKFVDEGKGYAKGAIAGALNPNSKRARKFAIAFYEEIRKRTTDCKVIAERTGIPLNEVEKAKRHLFMEVHKLSDGTKQFYEDYDIARSWQRLTDKNEEIEDHDIILVKHEALESDYMAQGMPQGEAHDKTEETYNYARALYEWRKDGGK